MDIDVAVVGGGAAGIAAAHTLRTAGISCMILEARRRLGGRAHTVTTDGGLPLDLGCGWLHSADENPWTEIAGQLGFTIDRSAPPWMRRGAMPNFSAAEQDDFARARDGFSAREETAAQRTDDPPLSALLEPGNRWNGLLDAVSTYVSGAELDRVSTRDLRLYRDSGENWRLPAGYGTLITALARDVPVTLDCIVDRIDHGGRRIRIETSRGTVAAGQVIVTLPSDILAAGDALFSPALPAKAEAAAGLPLGLADKLFLSLAGADKSESGVRLFGRTDSVATASYDMRPFGRPVIEAYFGGRTAAELERGGDGAFFDFARAELTGVFGHGFARRISPLAVHRWAADPFARGSYSFALPGRTGCRAVLAEPVDGRIFFAGEACSVHDYSTAHGAYRTGVKAAGEAMAGRRGGR